MEIRDGPEGPDGPVLYTSYCARHACPQPHLSGQRPAPAPPCLLPRVRGWLAQGCCPAGRLDLTGRDP